MPDMPYSLAKLISLLPDTIEIESSYIEGSDLLDEKSATIFHGAVVY